MCPTPVCSLNDEYPTLIKMLLPWLDVLEYQGLRMLEEQHCISPVLLDSIALAHGQMAYQMAAFTTWDKDSRVFTRHLMRRPGLAIRRSMELNGFARVPDAVLLGGGTLPACTVVFFCFHFFELNNAVSSWSVASWVMDGDRRWQLLAGTAHSFVGNVLLGRLINENYSLYRSFHFRRYTALCCSDVFGVATPAGFPALFLQYMGLALMQYLVTKLHFKVAVSLTEDRHDLFSNYRIRRLEYRNQRGQDEDWLFHHDGVFTHGSAASVFHADVFSGISLKVQLEAVLYPELVQVMATQVSLRYDNRDGLSEALMMDVQGRAGNVGRPDETLYMEAWRGMLQLVDVVFGQNNLIDERATLIQEVLMASAHLANLRAWPQIHRMGHAEERLRIWPIEPLQPAGGHQSTRYFASLDLKYFAAMRRRVTNQDAMDLGAFENMAEDLDTLAIHWQARQIANHFFSLSKRYPERVRILVDE